ncbi:MAG: TIGR00730 family Rossman fold protein [Geobacter sp.]|nr:TIGR00730 family Rossman fold protein [Geobacteraceae bacterium]MSM39096.1 TIGR00730 family Rossman fold protein [Geobacter sp.]
MKMICVYCGSNPGRDSRYVEEACSFVREMTVRNIGLVYGGASIGVMGAIADTVLHEGGEVVGVIPQSLVDKEIAHNGLTELKIVGSMHERKALMAELSDGFIALPGGLGTLEEIIEVLTWAQLGFHTKPCGLLNILGYYDGLSSFLNHAVHEQFIKKEHHSMLIIENNPQRLLNQFLAYKSPLQMNKWIQRDGM